MIHSRIEPGTLRDRLDASYYTPEVLENEALLRARGATALRTLIDTDASNYGVLPPSEDYLPSGSGVPLIRGGDLDGGTIRDPEVDAPLSFKNARGTTNVGDLLLLIKGACIDSPAGVALVSERHAGSVFNGSCYRVKVAPACDAGYLVAYCQTRQLLLQKKREIANTGIAYNAEDSVLGYLVPALSLDAQRYIGDKIRQAERLRERVRRLEAEFRNAVTVALPSSSSMAGRTSRVGTGEMGRNLNPGAHTPDRRAVRAAIRSAGGRSLDTLADVESPTTDSYPATAPYLGLDAVDSATCGLKPSTAAAESVAGTVRVLREGPTLSRLRPYLNKVTYIPPALAGGIGSTELLLVCPKTGVDGWFLYGVLKLESSVRQLNPVATGSTHPRVDREDVLDLLVPWRDEHETLGAKLRTAQDCYFGSTALTLTATTLVENLIDGRLNEADLVAAQKALEVGDRSADREILKSLRQSIAPDAKSPIADVDVLNALLDGPEERAP
jgi:type I restriction enzyme S subunit